MRHVEAAQHLLERFQIKKHPIPVQEVARKLGIDVTFEAFERGDNLSGVLFKDGVKVAMAINKHDPQKRQRFTIAHEIGHFVLKHKGELFVDNTFRLQRDDKSALAVDPLEIEANGFAAELLMPRSMLIKEVEKRLKNPNFKPDSAFVSELADCFDVSSQAMNYRLENLGLLYPA